MVIERKTPDDIDNVCIALERAKEYGLEPEVMLYALYAIQNNKDITIVEALHAGLNEWDV